MEMNRFIKNEKSLKKLYGMLNEKLEGIERAEKELKDLSADFEKFKDEIPAKTDIEKILKNYNGKKVVVTLYNKIHNKFEEELPQPLDYSDSNGVPHITLTYNNGVQSYMPLITLSNNTVTKITDVAGNVIFENKHLDRPFVVQEGLIYGAGRFEKAIENLKAQLTSKKEDYDKTLDALYIIPKYIEAGKKVIPQQLLSDWEAEVCDSVCGNSHGQSVENVLVILNAMSKGETIAEARKLLGDECSESTCFNVMWYSKDNKGVDFYKKYSENYNNEEYHNQVVEEMKSVLEDKEKKLNTEMR